MKSQISSNSSADSPFRGFSTGRCQVTARGAQNLTARIL